MRDLIPSMLVGLVLPAVVLLTVAAIPPTASPQRRRLQQLSPPAETEAEHQRRLRCISHHQIGSHQADQLLHSDKPNHCRGCPWRCCRG